MYQGSLTHKTQAKVMHLGASNADPTFAETVINIQKEWDTLTKERKLKM